MREWITGRNPVYEVLRANRREFFRLWLAEGNLEQGGHLQDALTLARQKKIPVERVPRTKLFEISANHQGLALQVGGYRYASLPEMLALARNRAEAPFILLLDLIQDPQNLGTLLRCAEGFGVHGVLIPSSRAAEVTPAVVNASSGACEHLLIAQMNLAQSIEVLKEENIWIYGLEYSDQAVPIESVDFHGGVGLVVGSEGSGLRSLVRSKCDRLISLPRRGKVDSLNAATAGAIALYVIQHARQKNL
ncbi:MAG TPA: 23S rRNA (guanosine(2251)-2'-O)-methyltransferase RlmB [Anaerolineaceae bacterium]|jgi:23S rRNA (guanosine2251-2'-O)-methyltransferase|nr:23S rRNA (guanosine(2251)-2'-O)-methyltransferase RlmB [Anaerolineaceae bacterium]